MFTLPVGITFRLVSGEKRGLERHGRRKCPVPQVHDTSHFPPTLLGGIFVQNLGMF